MPGRLDQRNLFGDLQGVTAIETGHQATATIKSEMKIFVSILIVYICSAHYLISMQRNYKSASKESAFIPNGLSDEPLSAEVSLFNTMETKEIEGYPNYFVTSDGDVYSKKFNRTNSCKKLKRTYVGKGYLRVSLWGVEKRKTFLVHRLIALAFIPNPHNYKEINHLNSKRDDNRAINLEWCNQSQNILHGYKSGYCIPTKGELHGMHILTEAEVLKIRGMWIPRKFSQEKIASLFGVKRGAIKDIVERKTWRHI